MSEVSFADKLSFWSSQFESVLPAQFGGRDIDELEESEDVSPVQHYDAGNDDFGFLFMGKAGVGKTYVMTALMTHVLKQCHVWQCSMAEYVAYYPIGYLLFKLRNERNPDEFDNCVNARFLFLDDLGAENTTDFAREHFFTILDLRCQKKYPTFITTNLNYNELKEKYGERVVSRLKEMCVPITIKGDDRRVDHLKERMQILQSRRRTKLIDVSNG